MVINYKEGGYKTGGGHVKFYPYGKGRGPKRFIARLRGNIANAYLGKYKKFSVYISKHCSILTLLVCVYFRTGLLSL